MGLLVGIIVLLAFGMGMILIAVRRQQQTAAMGERLSTFTERTLTLEELELQLPFKERVLIPFFRTLLDVVGKVNPQKNADKVRNNLEQAGNPNGLTPTMFMGIRIVLMLALLGLFVLIVTAAGLPLVNKLMYSTLGAALGYLLPGMWLGSKIKARKNNVLKSMPDALDLLSIAVEAGLGFDLALHRVAGKWDNELSREFQRVISDTRLGIPRRESLKAMADRCQVEPLSAFVAAIIQAEQLGASMSKILKIQSEQMRIKRRQRAEELANAAPLKMLFPMALLIFPSILVIILGPAVPKFMGAGPLS